MRLNLKDIQSIIRIAKEIYGEDVSVYLFGSRTDDTKRGGDIDLDREFEICDRHIQRIDEALQALQTDLPMTRYPM